MTVTRHGATRSPLSVHHSAGRDSPNPRKRRALLIRLGNALDEVTKDLVDQMIGEAVEAQPVPRRRPTLRALGRKRGDSR